MQASYILPIRRNQVEAVDELTAYLRWLSARVDVIVVDGSPPAVFAEHHARWAEFATHIPPDPDLIGPNGKVGGVLTGMRYARHERLVLADDDVRYDLAALTRLVALLDRVDVVRPQNYFDPLPWHARWDTGRTLLNRMTGGDWPGTLGVRRSIMLRTGGYAGDALFENFELVRTVVAAGGSELAALDLFVRRLPPTTHHFWSQRVRQAYDEFARPLRLGLFLSVLPLLAGLIVRKQWRVLALKFAGIVVLAELGRRRAGGRQIFPFSAALLAPAWVVERAICVWLAVGTRVRYGGVRYSGGVLRQAATPLQELQRRYHAGQRLHALAAPSELETVEHTAAITTS